MYRHHIKDMAEQEQPGVDPQIVARVANLPVVSTAYDQITTLYQQTKEHNKILKYTLETAETGVKSVATTAMPLVNKLEKPISALDNLACDGLDKLEEKYPLIRQPSEEVYKGTLKPVVDYSMDKVVMARDTVNLVTSYGVDTVTSAKDYSTEKVKQAKDTVNLATAYGINTVNSAKDYGVNTISSAKDYSVDQANNLKNYTCTKIDAVKQYSFEKLDDAKNYGTEKLTVAMETPYGQAASGQLDRALDWTEGLMDYYLPEEKADDGEKKDEEKTPEGGSLAPLNRALNISTKAKQRMYTQALRNLKHVQMRTQETLEKLNFTVDLISYAKTNIDEVQTSVTSKISQIWVEISATEEEAENLTLNSDETVSQSTLEKRLIATARHLTLRVKGGVASISDNIHYLPKSVTDRLANLKAYSDELYNSFSSAKGLSELPTYMLNQTKEKVSYLQETISFVADYLASTPLLNWMGLQNKQDTVSEEIQMEALPSSEQQPMEETKQD